MHNSEMFFSMNLKIDAFWYWFVISSLFYLPKINDIKESLHLKRYSMQ